VLSDLDVIDKLERGKGRLVVYCSKQVDIEIP